MEKWLSTVATELEEMIASIRRHLILDKRRPFIVESAGTPKSGKTTTINALHQLWFPSHRDSRRRNFGCSIGKPSRI